MCSFVLCVHYFTVIIFSRHMFFLELHQDVIISDEEHFFNHQCGFIAYEVMLAAAR